jgi:hypothetical protein
MATLYRSVLMNKVTGIVVLTEPVVNPEIWNEVPNEEVGPSELLDDDCEDADGDGNTNVAQNDELGILGLIQRRAWIEMVDASEVSVFLSLTTTLSLLLMVVMSGNIGSKIQPPPCKLLTD